MSHFEKYRLSEKSRLSELIMGKRLLELRKIHKPVFSYFGSVYMTYLSVIQGLIMSVSLIYFIYGFVYKAEGYSVLLLPVLSFSVLLWHNYVMHHQIVGWQLCYADTIIIVLLGCTQVIAASFPIIAIEALKVPPDDRKYLSDFALWLIGTDNYCVFFYEFIALIISAVIGLCAYCFSNKNLKEDYVKNIISAYYGLDIYIEMVSVEKKLFRITFFSNAWIIFLFVIWLVFQHYINYDKFIVDIVFAVILFFSYLVLTLIYDTKKHLNNIYVQKKK